MHICYGGFLGNVMFFDIRLFRVSMRHTLMSRMPTFSHVVTLLVLEGYYTGLLGFFYTHYVRGKNLFL